MSTVYVIINDEGIVCGVADSKDVATGWTAIIGQRTNYCSSYRITCLRVIKAEDIEKAEAEDALKEQALSKLTPEERAALGL
jgi:hypothetical protein